FPGKLKNRPNADSMKLSRFSLLKFTTPHGALKSMRMVVCEKYKDCKNNNLKALWCVRNVLEKISQISTN
ncbi:hypothetical protein OU793_22530, partial [Vibrio sp. VP6]|uniref:hypothetical protein n=1 Tax=Vibrio sp. VP6 TaxID=2992766 RepID=UPI00237B00EC